MSFFSVHFRNILLRRIKFITKCNLISRHSLFLFVFNNFYLPETEETPVLYAPKSFHYCIYVCAYLCIDKSPLFVCVYIYKWSAHKLSSHVIWKTETFIEEDTRYKNHCTQDNDASVPFKVGTSGPHTGLPIAISCPIVFSWISSISKVILVLGKARSHGAPNLGCRESESPGWFVVSPKDSAQDVMHKRANGCHEVANHQLSIAMALLNHPNSFCRGMFNINAKSDADVLLYSLSHFECDGHTVHVLTQWHLPPH